MTIVDPEASPKATRAIERVIILPWPSPALSPNSRTHWRARALQDAADKGRIPHDYPMLAIYREQVEAPRIGGPASVASLLPNLRRQQPGKIRRPEMD